uniref:Transcription initiation factor TFIID subunit 13 n=1 Tax=Rhabditophanes sp. KR3021 TaxID=114890 RepID=A0AC35U173_9BILA
MEDNSLFNFSDEEQDDKNTKPEDRKTHFRKELTNMLYGFGDAKIPFDETIDLLEVMVNDYIRDISLAAMNTGKQGKITLEDIHYLIGRDAKKYGRVKELLHAHQDIKIAKKKFEEKYD